MSTATEETLSQTIERLQEIIREKDDEIRSLSADLLVKEEEIARYRHKLFGRSSEKLTGDDARQGVLVNEAEETSDGTAASRDGTMFFSCVSQIGDKTIQRGHFLVRTEAIDNLR